MVVAAARSAKEDTLLMLLQPLSWTSGHLKHNCFSSLALTPYTRWSSEWPSGHGPRCPTSPQMSIQMTKYCMG